MLFKINHFLYGFWVVESVAVWVDVEGREIVSRFIVTASYVACSMNLIFVSFAFLLKIWGFNNVIIIPLFEQWA